MITVKHLSKTYQTRKSKIVNALDDIDLHFDETGMVRVCYFFLMTVV